MSAIMRSAAVLVVVAVLAAACGDAGSGTVAGGESAPTATSVAAPTTIPTTSTTTSVPPRDTPDRLPETIPPDALEPPPVRGEVPARYLDPVIADAAAWAGVAVGDVVVVRDQAIEWNDGSLGCPVPGEFYMQVIIPGYRVVVEAGGETLDYRLDERGNFRLCDQPFLPGGGAPTS